MLILSAKCHLSYDRPAQLFWTLFMFSLAAFVLFVFMLVLLYSLCCYRPSVNKDSYNTSF